MKNKNRNILPDQKTAIFTPEGVNISERVNTGKTVLFFTPESAKKHADYKRSYVYPAFDKGHNLIGYCVPK